MVAAFTRPGPSHGTRPNWICNIRGWKTVDFSLSLLGEHVYVVRLYLLIYSESAINRIQKSYKLWRSRLPMHPPHIWFFFCIIGSTYVFWASFLHCHQNQRSNRSFPSSCLFLTLAAVVFLFRIKRVKNKGIRRTNNKNEGLKSVSFVSYFNGSGSSSLFWLLLPFSHHLT